jgi:lysophospholipid acyltransferase (LPLAT)-like uncharacterized protein
LHFVAPSPAFTYFLRVKLTPLKTRLLTALGALWMRSLRIRLTVPEDFRPGILGLWHKDLLASCAAFKDKNVHILVSESSDGEFFAQAAKRLHYIVTRGSDTHGATNVRHLLKSLRDNRFVGMALDGPRGPALQVKPGSLWLSKASGRPLWLFCIKYGRHFRLNGWDNFIIPLPLSSIDIEIKYLLPENNSKKENSRDRITS